jgi:hypothetical protein
VSEFEEGGTYHGSFTIDDQLVSYTVDRPPLQIAARYAEFH